MSLIHISDSSGNRDESSDLGTHVLLCSQKYQVLMDRVDRIEKRIDDIIQQNKDNKRIIIGAFITVVTGTITSLITILIKLPH
jgi:hypothetical protein